VRFADRVVQLAGRLSPIEQVDVVAISGGLAQAGALGVEPGVVTPVTVQRRAACRSQCAVVEARTSCSAVSSCNQRG